MSDLRYQRYLCPQPSGYAESLFTLLDFIVMKNITPDDEEEEGGGEAGRTGAATRRRQGGGRWIWAWENGFCERSFPISRELRSKEEQGAAPDLAPPPSPGYPPSSPLGLIGVR